MTAQEEGTRIAEVKCEMLEKGNYEKETIQRTVMIVTAVAARLTSATAMKR
jgi:hypothetical protein